MSALRIRSFTIPKTKPQATKPTSDCVDAARWALVMEENRRCDAKCPGVLEGILARIGSGQVVGSEQ